MSPSDLKVDFETSLDDLPSGGYVATWDGREQTVNAVSLESGSESTLLRVIGAGFEPGLYQTDLAGSVYLAPTEDNEILVFDLRDQRQWRLGPLCGRLYGLSPGGQYVLSQCAPPGTPGGSRIFEVVSVNEGGGFRLSLPQKNDHEYPVISWIDDQTLFASRVWVEGNLMECTVPLGGRDGRCNRPIAAGFTPSDWWATGAFVPFVNLDLYPWEGLVVPGTCLSLEQCEGTATLGAIPGQLRASPSGEEMASFGAEYEKATNRIAIDSTLVYFLRSPSWELTPLAKIEGDYGFDAWCPSGVCILLSSFEQASPPYKLDLDGTLTPFPHGLIIGSFTVP